LATLVIGGTALGWFYRVLFQSEKLDADMVTRISQTDIVRCGNDLYARANKAGENGYRVIKKR
jgi:hypothetical protein